MTLAINDTAPDFEAQTTEGKIRFHDWIGNSWAVLFSHPKDFTPVCTTELGYMAKIKPEFDKRGVKIIGLSVDPLDRHSGWANDIKETQGFAPNYPMIADVDYNVSKLYGMLPAPVSGDPTKRTPADNQTVRNVFVIGPDKKIKLILVYPMTTGRNFDEVLRVIDSLQLVRELDLKLVKAVDTHLHADHVTGLGALRDRSHCITVMGEQTHADVVSMRVTEGDRIDIEGLSLDVLYTPGHTDDSYSYLLDDRIFTGDTLLI